ncbi:MAG: GntR family transcriptional regulator [Oscillospiraceae bacterium]|nr:GntR family transcriptional regulator [Oscillospiraceae bacterium]
MISINYRDPRPIYEQVKESLRRLIITGALPPQEKLPSVRELASSLAINPNTIQRAYRELEAEGYIISMPGKGSFACGSTEENGKRRQELLEKFSETAEELRWLGLSTEELCEHLRKGEKNG